MKTVVDFLPQEPEIYAGILHEILNFHVFFLKANFLCRINTFTIFSLRLHVQGNRGKSGEKDDL